MAQDQLERDTQAVARELAEVSAGRQSRIYHLSWWNERLLDWAMADEEFKTQLFRLIDVYPATHGPDDVVRHLREYLRRADAPPALVKALEVADRTQAGRRLAAWVADRNIRRMGNQFIAGRTPQEATDTLAQLWRGRDPSRRSRGRSGIAPGADPSRRSRERSGIAPRGTASTVDLLGEKTVTAAEADDYAARVRQMMDTLLQRSQAWPADETLESDDLGPLPRVNMSIKPTALAPQFAPLTASVGLAQAADRLRPLLKRAADRGVFVFFDMEHYDVKDLTLRLFKQLLDEPELAELNAGIAIQAYLKDSHRDLEDLLGWARGRARPIGVRLVKGAYWDTETVLARREGWPVPVFESKAQTDANYERCVDLLHEAHGTVRAAFGSHNVRSIGYAVASARHRGIPDNAYEVQMLYGMAEPIQAAVRRFGLRLRLYVPVGELVPGMAYLVRRLLENTSNESFVRRRFVADAETRELIAPPEPDELPEPEPAARRPATDPTDPGPYRWEPRAEWHRPQVRDRFGAAIAEAEHSLGQEVPALIGGEQLQTTARIESVDPGRLDVLVASSASCSTEHADAAVEAARRAQPAWADTPVDERAGVLFATAEWMRERRDELAALEAFEAAKPWAEAHADVAEAIDFCEYYGREMRRLAEGPAVASPPGEANTYSYLPRGVGVVISPWNFPLAIPTGMVTAALVAGNAVVFKPAEQTPAVAWRLVEALYASGLPEGALSFVPGVGEQVGAHLVEHPDVGFIAFTGSKEVGLRINEQAAAHRPGQRQVKRTVAEMGSKNALVIDADADLDEAVPAICHSAFSYAGQKCSAASRLIVVGAVYEELIERLVGATEQLIVGHAAEPATQVPPVIEAAAHQQLTEIAENAGRSGQVLLARDDVPDGGWFVGPTIVGDVHPDARIACEELFGPILTVMRADDLQQAIALANRTDYALTAGIFSRSPANIQRAAARLRGGNIYINRGITGAVPGRQPFGGYGMSGVGSKAGGPDYLIQFLNPRVVTENTLRQGFAPPPEERHRSTP